MQRAEYSRIPATTRPTALRLAPRNNEVHTMSLDATRWAWKLTGIRPAEKLILLSLADRAGESHTCYPSSARLTADTGLDRKTVLAVLQHLEKAGHIEVTRRPGLGNVYRLIGVEDRHQQNTRPETGTGTSPKNGTGQNHTSPKNGTGPVPKTGRVPVPKTGHESTNESRKNLPASASAPASAHTGAREPATIRTDAEVAEGKKRLAAILNDLTGKANRT